MPRGSSPPSSDDDGASAQLPSSESCEVSGLCKAQVLSEFGAGVFVRVFLVSKRSRLAEAVVFCGGGLSWVVVVGHLCAARVSAPCGWGPALFCRHFPLGCARRAHQLLLFGRCPTHFLPSAWRSPCLPGVWGGGVRNCRVPAPVPQHASPRPRSLRT